MPVAMLTTFADEAYVADAIELGALGFLLKSDGPRDLIAAVKAIAGGGAAFSPRLARWLVRTEATGRLRRDLRHTDAMDFQFGVNIPGAATWDDFAGFVRRADELGFDILAAPDHLGAFSPFQTLAAAGGISPRIRLRTYVLNVGFWNPALLAREVATLDRLSGGRAELGIGAGHMRSEHEDAGLPWRPLEERVAAMEAVALEVRRRLADEHEPRPVQDRVPLVVGAMSRRGLDVAARHADVVALAGLRQVKGSPPGTFALASATDADAAVARVRELADGRAYRTDLLVQVVRLGRPPAEAAAELAAAIPGADVSELLDNPFVLLAETAEDAAATLRARRARYGLDGVVTHHPSLEAMGEVIAAFRGTRGGDGLEQNAAGRAGVASSYGSRQR